MTATQLAPIGFGCMMLVCAGLMLHRTLKMRKARRLSDQAKGHFDRKEFGAAAVLFEESISVGQSLMERLWDDRFLAEQQYNRMMAHLLAGQHQQAFEAAAECFACLEFLDEPLHLELLCRLAELHVHFSQHRRAIGFYTTAAAMAKEKSPADLPVLLHQLGLSFSALGLHAHAVKVLKEALDHNPTPLTRELVDTNLGIAFLRMKQWPEAERHTLLAMEAQRKRGEIDLLELSRPRLNLGTIYAEQGRVEEAEIQYRQALAVREPILGRGHPRVAMLLSNLANCRRQLGDLDAATAYVLEALQTLRAEGTAAALCEAVDTHSKIEQDRGNLAQAIVLATEAGMILRSEPSHDVPRSIEFFEREAELAELMQEEEHASECWAQADAIRRALAAIPPPSRQLPSWAELMADMQGSEDGTVFV